MKNRNVFMIFAAFIFGYCLQGMMNMYGGRLIEGSDPDDPYTTCKEETLLLDVTACLTDSDCNIHPLKDPHFKQEKGYCPWPTFTCDNGKFVVGECGQPPG